MNYSVILLAAGTGSRMNLGYNKMFYSLNGQPIIVLTSRIFIEDKNCTQIIYVINESDQKEMIELLKKHHSFVDKCIITSGGKERQNSVYNGLQLVNNEIVLVHDGARPFITQDLINSLVKNTNQTGCAIPGVRVKDTIKVVNNFVVQETLPRQLLYAVQTPQACLTHLLRNVHQQANQDQYLGTDEASLIEKYSDHSVKIVESSYENIKITTSDDLIHANILYKKYFEEER